MPVGKKQVAFDLDTKALKIYYPSESWNNAYDIIKRKMLKNDFSWQQGSVYVSNKPMLSRDVSVIIEELIKDNPWLNKCMRDCRQTNIGKEHSQNHLFDIDANIIERSNIPHKKPSILTALAQAKEKADVLNATRPIKPKSKTKEIER